MLSIASSILQLVVLLLPQNVIDILPQNVIDTLILIMISV